jgi:hypothetical protein
VSDIGQAVALVVHRQHQVIPHQPRALFVVTDLRLEVILAVGAAGDTGVTAHMARVR